MKNPNQDLLDLCTLNQLRDANEESVLPETEKESLGKAIDWKIRHATQKIINKEREVV